jgi:hypothetical protein
MLLVATFTLGPLVANAQQTTVAPTQVANDVRKTLLSLPYYGVFDLLTVNVDKNDVVTLGGYVLSGSLKKDAEREARDVKGAKEVQNKIAAAPVFPMDDAIRRGVYRAIYGDPSLSQYGTPGSEFWPTRPAFRPWGAGFGGWRRGLPGQDASFRDPSVGLAPESARLRAREFGGPHLTGAPFYGYDPIGNYAIHILVNNRTVTLVGVVDNQSDKDIAGIKARGVRDVTQVNNELEVAPKS